MAKSAIANKIYDVLVDLAGAIEDEREDFVQYFNNSKRGEWRFRGKLGFGGKLYFSDDTWPNINCYQEDMNNDREKIINQTNDKIRKLMMEDEIEAI